MNAHDQDDEVKKTCENTKAECEKHLSSGLFAQNSAAAATATLPACKTVDDDKIFKVET